MTYWKCFRFLATLVVCGTQLANYAVEIIQMTLESAWIYEIHHFQLKFLSIYHKEVKIIAITYFLATLPILATKIAITRYLVIVLTWESFGVFEVYFKQTNRNIIFTSIFATFHFEIAVKWSKSRIFETFQLEHA